MKRVLILVYVTGDTHGNFERFKEKSLKKLKRNDTIIVCGDFGFIWNNSYAEKVNLGKERIRQEKAQEKE